MLPCEIKEAVTVSTNLEKIATKFQSAHHAQSIESHLDSFIYSEHEAAAQILLVYESEWFLC